MGFLAVGSAHAQDALEGIKIEPELNTPKYVRSEYGGWRDDDRDCQNNRAEVLIQESLAVVDFRSDRGCTVDSGRWYDPYTDKTYVKASEVQIDHFVALKQAHVSGGHSWSKEKKVAYSNHLKTPLHLIAVHGPTNQSKSDKDPAKWLPPNQAYHCDYVRTWIAIKLEWNLSMDQAEADNIRQVLSSC